jgi:hypothetical protein
VKLNLLSSVVRSAKRMVPKVVDNSPDHDCLIII